MATWCLSVHAPWACRQSGMCCRTGWAIPVEAPVFEILRRQFPDAPNRLVTGGPLPEGAAAMLAQDAHGVCTFLEGPLCGIHRRLGPGAQPAACRQFPRQALRDARGTFVSLSHFCPTAAGLLFEPQPVTIVPAPRSIALDDDLEAFEATDALPPLLRAGVLTDLDGYDAWERLSIAALVSAGRGALDALEHVAAATEAVMLWQPGHGALGDAVSRAFAGSRSAQPEAPLDEARLFALASAAVPKGLAAPRLPDCADLREARRILGQYDRVVRAYLAARLFGTWIAYYAGGLSTIVEYLRVCAAVLTIETARQRLHEPAASAERCLLEAVRETDRLLVHLADAGTLTRAIERDSDPRAPAIPGATPRD